MQLKESFRSAGSRPCLNLLHCKWLQPVGKESKARITRVIWAGRIIPMLNDALRQELMEMREEDLSVRQELLDSGELGAAYVPRMEAIHIKNAARLRALIAAHGWPGEDIAGKDGAEAAWLTVQHAIGEPEFQRHALALLRTSAEQ